MEPPIFLTAFLLFAKGCEAVACVTQSTPILCTATYLQPSGPFVVPAVINPQIKPVEPISEPCRTIVPDFCSYPYLPPPMPPVFVGGKEKNNDWRHLLLFLLFAMQNRGGGGGCGCGSCGYPCGGCGGGCGNGCGCGGGYCGGCGCGGGCCGGCGGVIYEAETTTTTNNNNNNGGNDVNNANNVIYVPYPIAVPMCPSDMYSFPTPYPFEPTTLPDDIMTSPGPIFPPPNCNCKEPNEINLTIKADCAH